MLEVLVHFVWPTVGNSFGYVDINIEHKNISI